MSRAADDRLHEVRVRRLLAIELDGVAVVEPEAVGPLGDEVIRIWIDVPHPRRAVLEVRRTNGPLARRALAIGGLSSDVAARLVAIATSEMVRVQALPRRRSPAPPAPRRERLEMPASFAVQASYAGLWLPASTPALLSGAAIAIEHRRGVTLQALRADWLSSPVEPTVRWVEIGGALGARLPLADGWRLAVGGRAGAAAVAFHDAAAVDGVGTARDAWIGHAAASIGADAALGGAAWLGLTVEPGATLHAPRVVDDDGASRSFGGFSLGFALTLAAEP
jgi:hypothetical protein